MRQALIPFFSFLLSALSSHAQDETQMHPAIWLGILDKQASIRVDTLGYDDLPENIEYKGLPVEIAGWKDSSGLNLLVLTQTGSFVKWNQKAGNPDEKRSRAEVYAYFYLSTDNGKTYNRQWKLMDFQECYEGDLYAGFFKRSLTVTDLNKNGVAEVTLIYKSACRTDVSPSTKKLILYEGKTKYALRGETGVPVAGNKIEPGTFKADEAFKANARFYDFAVKRWEKFQLDDFIQFYDN